MTPKLGQKVKSDSVYEGRIVSLWSVANDVQAFIQWRDTSGMGWGAPNDVWLIGELVPDPINDAWSLPRAVTSSNFC